MWNDKLEIDLRENDLPQSGEWTSVVDKRKQKFIAKKAEKAKQEREKARLIAKASGVVLPEEPSEKSQPKYADEFSDSPYPEVSKKPAKKPAKKAKESFKIKDEAHLVEVVQKIVAADPHHILPISAVGDRIQELTNAPWNKKFKPVYGSIKAFLAKHPKVFHIEEKNERVTLRADVEAKEKAAAAQAAALAAEKKAKAKAEQKAAHKAEKAQKKQAAPVEQPSSSSSVPIILAVLGVAAAAAAFAGLQLGVFGPQK
eukprot:TRINITY_DN313_c0_g1_i1.p1 TRINITY_DN313_c0_g1~~TRINITY_DN313_c0_g1_i1.p1  ORF type:complete len:281 (-),score=112.52 TRINITY_DN313_c0_g1_i1:233-1003(-)